ncbi:putative signaling protein [Patescibacteria group bacterium]|nr:putative signaling protein [Patescibacteria group bacterium]
MKDLNTDAIIWTEETFRLYDISPTDKPLTTEQFLALLHPDDMLSMKKWINDCLSGKQPAGLEFRTRPINEHYRWLFNNGILETDAKNKPLRMIGTVQDITERKKAERTIFNLVYYDPLTELPNRHLMLDRLKQILISRSLQHHYGAILFINLDNFRNLNDTQGHTVGDLLLLAISQRLQANVHQGDTIARIGGDEFVLILEALDEDTEQAAEQAKSIALRLLNAIQLPFNLQGYEYHCSASIGINLFCDHQSSVDELLKQADIAMHQAKQQGKNTVCFFDHAIQTMLESRVQMESWMRKNIDSQYSLYYQLQVDSENNPIGAETLIRWHHPERGIILPTEFIPLAEKTGLILQIGQWVLETACAQLKAWENNPYTKHLILAVNVSAKQFHQANFVTQVLDLINRTQISPDKLKLELTESMLVDNIEETINKMNELKNHGIKFSLDDFGTGFSSLSYLKRLPFDQLKIDQSFVQDALENENDAAIIQTIIALGQSLGMEVIAEGVETKAHKNSLAAYGCQYYQGYLFGKPKPLPEFEKLLQTLYSAS